MCKQAHLLSARPHHVQVHEPRRHQRPPPIVRNVLRHLEDLRVSTGLKCLRFEVGLYLGASKSLTALHFAVRREAHQLRHLHARSTSRLAYTCCWYAVRIGRLHLVCTAAGFIAAHMLVSAPGGMPEVPSA